MARHKLTHDAEKVVKALTRVETLIGALEYMASGKHAQAGDTKISEDWRKYHNGIAHGLEIAASNLRSVMDGATPRLLTPAGAKETEALDSKYFPAIHNQDPADFMHSDGCPQKYGDTDPCSCVVWEQGEAQSYNITHRVEALQEALDQYADNLLATGQGPWPTATADAYTNVAKSLRDIISGRIPSLLTDLGYKETP